MHPHGGQHDEVEDFAARAHDVEVGQGIVEPFDPRRRMQRDRALAQRRRRLDRDDPVPERREAGRVASGPGPISRTRAGGGGNRCETARCASSNEKLSYCRSSRGASSA